MGSVFDASSLKSYRLDMAGFTPLDRETERKLAKRWIEGDAQAGEEIVLACLPFVITIALEYRRWGVPLEDIVQEGNLGLLRAAKKFDPDKQCRLATYAAYWIRAEIREYVVRSFRVVRLGTTKSERRALRAYRTTREADPEKLAAVSGLTPERASLLLPILASKEASLDVRHGDMAPAVERLAGSGLSPEDEVYATEVRVLAKGAVDTALESLSERERLIVRSRMMSEDPTTLQELGNLLGVSKERVRQLEERAVMKLRGSLAGLKDQVQAGVLGAKRSRRDELFSSRPQLLPFAMHDCSLGGLHNSARALRRQRGGPLARERPADTESGTVSLEPRSLPQPPRRRGGPRRGR